MARIGNFTSSEIVKLLADGKKAGTLGAPAIGYIAEKNMERRLCRSLDNDQNSRPTSWGNLCESHVFSMLPLDYSTISKNSIPHPSFDFWTGSPDSVCHDYEPATDGIIKVLTDIKCPFTLKSFCGLVDAWNHDGIAAIRDCHADGEKFYWQIVSNAIITGCDHGELIVYAPYKSELVLIRELADMHDVGWIKFANDDELPWIHDGGYYKNINHFRFPIPQSDKDKLTARVVECGKQLVQPELIPA